jgi:hypothetical protein
MTDFWHSCGHHFLDRDESGGYVVTDDFLKVYLARPELIPPPDACSAERNLHAAAASWFSLAIFEQRATNRLSTMERWSSLLCGVKICSPVSLGHLSATD